MDSIYLSIIYWLEIIITCEIAEKGIENQSYRGYNKLKGKNRKFLFAPKLSGKQATRTKENK